MDRDPLHLTPETFAAHQRREARGPASQAAIDHGIDLTLLERNLALTPTERMNQHDEALRLYFEHRR